MPMNVISGMTSNQKARKHETCKHPHSIIIKLQAHHFVIHSSVIHKREIIETT